MALKDRKVSEWLQPVSSLDDKPRMTAKELKAAFDSNSNQIKPAINGIIDDLTGVNGASNIGLTAISGVNGTNIQVVLKNLATLSQNTNTNIQKLLSTNGASLIGLNPVTGVSASNIQQAIVYLADSISKIDSYLGQPVAISQGGTGAKTAQQALYMLGSGSRKNWIDNSYFIGGGVNGKFPINQRGNTTYISGNFIDRWCLTGTGSQYIALDADGIRLYSNSTYGAYVTQELTPDVVNELKGKEVNLSAWFYSNEAGVSIYLNVNNKYFNGVGGNTLNGLVSKNFTIPQDTQSISVVFGASKKGTTKIKAAKLELGQTQTLLRQDSSGTLRILENYDYASELLKCQRYLQIYSSADKRPIKAIDCRPQMRIDPTQSTIQINNTTYYVNSAEL